MNNSDHNHYLAINLIGQCHKFREIINQSQKISRYDVPVFIFGETGTGKELIARAIHSLSDRSAEPFIPVNCGSIPESLVENELFGHVKGAYTSAQSSSIGLLSQANGGTLFLDEIDTLSLKGQVSLLRFIQEKEFKPLGSHKSCHSDVRFIAATNADILSLIEQEKFRQDLYFRLNIMKLDLPPLRERGSDIELLSNHLINRHRTEHKLPKKTLHPDAIERLYHYNWPGNVRELENILLSEMLLSETEMLTLKNLNFVDTGKNENFFQMKPLFNMKFRKAKEKIVSSFEKNYLENVMEKTSGNVTKAAAIAGTERRAFGKLLKKHDINRAFYTS